MNSHTVLQAMTSYVVENTSETEAGSIANLKVIDVLVSSFEVLEFVMELEENLELDDDILDIAELAPKFAKLTFAQLADEIAQHLNHHQTVTA